MAGRWNCREGLALAAPVKAYVQDHTMADNPPFRPVETGSLRRFKRLNRRGTVRELVVQLLVIRENDGFRKSLWSQLKTYPRMHGRW